MARHNKNSPAEDLVMLVAMMPWWLGLTIGVIAFFILDHYALRETIASAPGNVTGPGALVGPMLIRELAGWGRWIVPAICLAGAVVSVWKQRERRALVSKVLHHADATKAINEMNWVQFERLVSEGFRRNGYAVVEHGGAGADGGIDLVLRKDGELHLVQCKQWRAQKVSVTVVRELYGVMAAMGASGGFVVTSGAFTRDAMAFASGRNVNLIDGPMLLELIREGNEWEHVDPHARVAIAAVTMVQETVAPICPNCGASMVKRTAKRGASAGNAFWGCSGFPACRGMRKLQQ